MRKSRIGRIIDSQLLVKHFSKMIAKQKGEVIFEISDIFASDGSIDEVKQIVALIVKSELKRVNVNLELKGIIECEDTSNTNAKLKSKTTNEQ